MITPEFDTDGYPTEDTEQAIRDWAYTDANGCLDFVAAAWHWGDMMATRELSYCESQIVHATEEGKFLRLATGGWSGNESLVAALRANRMIYMLTWCLTARGGLHIFRYQ